MTMPKFKLNSFDEMFAKTNKTEEESQAEKNGETSKHKAIAILPFDLIDDFKGHAFRLYEGERKDDMVESIKTNGILQPAIVRTKASGRYEMLSGHNRKYCAMEAGLYEMPCIVKYNLSDEEAWIYVIETNIIQRSFADMLHSERAAVLSAQHSKLFSQGKRNDILRELSVLENPHEFKENQTLPHSGNAFRTHEKIGETYKLSKNTIARYLRIQQLTPALKDLLDSGKLPFIPAVTLSFLKQVEQELVNKCVEANSFKVDGKKAEILRQYSERQKLDENNVYLILKGEIDRQQKKKKPHAFKIKPAVYSKYFEVGQKPSEIEDVIEKALDFYFQHQGHDGSQEKAQTSNSDYAQV